MDLHRLSPRLGLPAAFLLGAISVFAGPSAVGAVQNAVPSVAVVDMDKVLQSYAPALAKQQEFKATFDQMEGEMKVLETRIEEANAQLSILDRNTKAFAQASLEHDLCVLRRDKLQEINQTDLGRRRLELSVDLFDEIAAGVAAFAKAQNIDVVLRARNAPAGASVSLRFENNQARDVIYYAAQVDLTANLIAFLKSWPGPKKDE